MDLDNIVDFFHHPNHHRDYGKERIYFILKIYLFTYREDVIDVVCGPGVVPNRIPPSLESIEIGVTRS